MSQEQRVIVWFSCGAASAVAAKLTLAKYGKERTHIVYCDTRSEHPDNERFLRECEAWFGVPIVVLASQEYTDTWDVFTRTRWLNGVKGARCTTELKKKLRTAYQQADDIQVFGYTAEELDRANRFRANNPEVYLETPLIEKGLGKADCLAMIERAGIALPTMYQLGYKNNNCIGCVKGQAGYWNKIRRDFPEVFNRMAKLEREIGAALCKTYAGDGERKKVFLDELPPEMGRYEEEPDISCSLLCVAAESEMKRTENP
jgi:PP-loop superfamily ATP-utilizing enzyme